MEDQKIIALMPKKDTSKRVFILMIWALLLLLAHIITPYVVRKHYENKGYAFLEHVAYINENRYQDQVSSLNEEVLFQEETLFYVGYKTIDLNRYDIVYSEKDIFEIGMMSAFFSIEPISFYAFEFLHGGPFDQDNEIVISESVSLTLFDKIDSVNETVIIEDVSFTVTGVFKDMDTTMSYIFMPISHKDTLGISIIFSLGFRVFKDQNLLERLYNRGGSDLVQAATTYKNQYKIQSTSRIITSFIYLILGFVSLGISNLMFSNENIKRYSYVKGPQPPFIKSMFESFIIVTCILLYMLFLLLAILASSTSFLMAIRYVIDEFHTYTGIFYIYLLPIVSYLVRKGVIYLYHQKIAK